MTILKTFLFCLISLLSLHLGAQRKFFEKERANSYGIRIGTGIITTSPEIAFAGNSADYVTHEILFKKSDPIFNIGGFYQKKMGWVFMKSELSYSHYVMRYSIDSWPGGKLSNLQDYERVQNLDLLINGGVIGNGFRLGVGPIAHILLKYRSALNSIPQYRERQLPMSFGFTFDIGYDIKKFTFDFRYERALKTIGDQAYLGARKSKFKGTPDQLTFTIGYLLSEID